MSKKRIITNAGAAIGQALVSGVVLFVLYRYLLDTIGVEKIGVWSLVLAATTASRMTELGIGGSVVPFVAKYRAAGQEDLASKVLQTATVTIAIVLGIFIAATYPVFEWLLAKIITGPEVTDALEVLPFALSTLLINAVAGTFQSGLEGCNRLDLRSYLSMGSSVIYFALTVALVPGFGLVGVAIAQLMQSLLLLVVAWMLIRKYMPALPLVPYQWTKSLFGQMIGYGVKFQLISIALMLIEPVTKSLMAKFGSLSMVGYYEMANRLIVQLRSLLMSANQALVPVFASAKQKDPGSVRNIYLNSYRIMFYLATPMFALIVAGAPLVSELWIGHYENVFVLFVLILACGWYVNTISIPSYFLGLGTSLLRWNTISHILMAVTNAGFGWVLALFWGGIGVAMGRALALAASSIILIVTSQNENDIDAVDLFRKEDFVLLVLSLSLAVATLPVYVRLTDYFSVLQSALSVFTFGMVIMSVVAWKHSMRLRIAGWLGMRGT